MRFFKPLAFLGLVLTLCVLPKLTAEEKLDLPGAKPTPQPVEAPVTRIYPWETADAAAMRARLSLRIPILSLDAVPFEEVIEYLSELTSLNITVNWSALETAAIESDKEVTIRVRDSRVDQLLDLVLEMAGGGEVELDYEIKDNAIVVSTREDVARRTSVQIYKVRDLLKIGMTDSGDLSALRPQIDRLQSLIEIIQTTVDPESWRECGGNTGAINDYADLLIVTQTQTGHRQIWDLLEKMRGALQNR